MQNETLIAETFETLPGFEEGEAEYVTLLEFEDFYEIRADDWIMKDLRPVTLLAEKQYFPKEVLLEAFAAFTKSWDKALEEGRAKI